MTANVYWTSLVLHLPLFAPYDRNRDVAPGKTPDPLFTATLPTTGGGASQWSALVTVSGPHSA
jgi:hypothetical protein